MRQRKRLGKKRAVRKLVWNAKGENTDEEEKELEDSNEEDNDHYNTIVPRNEPQNYFKIRVPEYDLKTSASLII